MRERDLEPEERKILARADAVLAAGGPFIESFWGAQPRAGRSALLNGLHAGNRVGHAQGGILVGMAAANAIAVLPRGWALSAVTALYVSPGEGRSLVAKSTVIHHGRLTAVVRTQITGRNRRRVLEVLTAHKASAGSA